MRRAATHARGQIRYGAAVKPLTLARATAWLGVALIGWSLNLRWGTDRGLPLGPPATHERTVVAALLLAVAAALAASVAGRKARAPGMMAKAIGLGGALGALACAAAIHSQGPASVLGGAGWPWLAVGAALATVAAGLAASLRGPAPPPRRVKSRRA
jgi:hypothetical protein